MSKIPFFSSLKDYRAQFPAWGRGFKSLNSKNPLIASTRKEFPFKGGVAILSPGFAIETMSPNLYTRATDGNWGIISVAIYVSIN